MNSVCRIPSVVQQTSRILTCVRRLNTPRVNLKRDEKEYILDVRQGQRELIKTYSSEGKDFRIELGDPRDTGMLAEFITGLFVNKVSMLTSIGMTHEELHQFIEPDVAEALQHDLSPVVFHEDRLVGTYIVKYFDENTLPKKLPFSEDLRRSGKAKFEIKPDYAEDIKNGPFSRKSNAIYVFLSEFYRQVGNLLPMDCRRVAWGETVGVHPNYAGHNLMNELCDITQDMAFEKHDADYFAAIAVSAAANHVAVKRRFPVAELPFDEFKADGKIVFDNRDDKVEKAVFRLTKLRKN